MDGVLIFGTTVGYCAAAFAWPTLRLWKREGIWPVVFSRKAAPVQRFFGFLTRALFVVLVGSSAIRAAFGPDLLGLKSVPAPLAATGTLLLITGMVLTVVAQHQMGASWRVGIDDRPTGLITMGVFRWVRNPVFTGLLIFLGGYVCVMPAWWTAALWACTAIALRVQISWEERHLIALHGNTYLAYSSRVGRLLPFVGYRSRA